MAEEGMVPLVVIREGDAPVNLRIRRLSPLAKLFKLYAEWKRLDVATLDFFHGVPPRRLLPDDTPESLGLTPESRIIVAAFKPFEPDHVQHSDIAFDVDGYVFRLHKYPMLRSDSPLIESLVELFDGDPVPMAVPGGARVFDIVARLCHSESPDTEISNLLTLSNIVDVRVAATFLQMDKLVGHCEAFLKSRVFCNSDATLTVLRSALGVDAADLAENNIVERCVSALSLTADWGTVGEGHPLLEVPPRVFATAVETAFRFEVAPRDLCSALVAYIGHHTGVAKGGDAGPLREGPAPVHDVEDVVAALRPVMYLVDPTHMSTKQALKLLAQVQSLPAMAEGARAWASAGFHPSAEVARADGTDGPTELLLTCVLLLGKNFDRLLDVDLSWLDGATMGLVVRNASAATALKRLILGDYLASRLEGPPDGAELPLGAAPPAPMTADDLLYVLRAAGSLAPPEPGDDGKEALEDQADADNEVVGTGGASGFYRTVFQAVLTVFAVGKLPMDAREELVGMLVKEDLLLFEHLPADVLHAGVTSPAMPTSFVYDGMRRQAELLQRQTTGARRALSAWKSAAYRRKVCRSNHLPVGTRVVVKRSTSSYDTGVVRGFVTGPPGLHHVVFSTGETGWYDLKRRPYEVVGGPETDSEEEEEGEEDDDSEGEAEEGGGAGDDSLSVDSGDDSA